MIHRNGVYSEYLSPDNAPAAAKHLETEGYFVQKNVFSSEELDVLREDIERVFDELPPDGRLNKRPKDEDEMFRYEMLNRSGPCQAATLHRLVRLPSSTLSSWRIVLKFHHQRSVDCLAERCALCSNLLD